jgi:hypothetical protein
MAKPYPLRLTYACGHELTRWVGLEGTGGPKALRKRAETEGCGQCYYPGASPQESRLRAKERYQLQLSTLRKYYPSAGREYE